jgi:hypothetical protein
MDRSEQLASGLRIFAVVLLSTSATFALLAASPGRREHEQKTNDAHPPRRNPRRYEPRGTCCPRIGDKRSTLFAQSSLMQPLLLPQ